MALYDKLQKNSEEITSYYYLQINFLYNEIEEHTQEGLLTKSNFILTCITYDTIKYIQNNCT